MQNKANFQKACMNVSVYSNKDCGNSLTLRFRKNKPKVEFSPLSSVFCPLYSVLWGFFTNQSMSSIISGI